MPIENSKKKKVTVVVLATIVLVTAISLAVTMLPLDPNSNSNSSSTASRDNIALSNTNTKTNANSNANANSAGLVYRALPDPSESKHPGGYCQDGSRAGYFIREGMPESKLFVIYLAGGGGCGTQEACDARGPRYSGNSTWITDREGGLQKDGFLDADCSKNPTFCEGTAVHVPYCTSDSHMGNNTQINDWGYYFDGHANFAFIVEELIEYYGLGQEGATVMLTGGSAGGRGAIYNVDWLADRLNANANANSDSDSKSDNPSTNVKVVSNCGWYLPNALPEDLPGDIYPPSDYENFAAGTQGNDMYLAAQMGVAGEIESQFRYHDLLPDDCLEVYRDDPIACLSSSNHYRFLKTPLFLSHTQYDKNQIFTQMRAPQKPESEAELATTESYIEHWGTATRASFQRIVAGDHLVAKEHPDGLFSASCIAHGSPLGLTIGTGSENGNGNRPEPASSVAWQTIAHDWFFQLGNYAESHQLIEDCGARASDGKTVPCNPAPVCQFPFLGGGGGGGGGDMDDIGDKNSLECLMKISQTGCVVSYGTFEDCEDCLKEKVADASAIEKQNMMKVCDTEIASKACLYASQNDLSEIDRDTVSDILNARGTGS